MRLIAMAFAAFLPCAAVAGDAIVSRTVDGVILPGFARLAAATSALDRAAQADCRAENPGLRAAYAAAFDAWIGVETYRGGPMETDGRNLAIVFWPDPKGATPKALTALVKAGEVPKGAEFAKVSVAARGLFALESMLYNPTFNTYAAQSPGCNLTQSIAADLASVAQAANSDWQNNFGPLMKTAGDAGNNQFLAPAEVVQQLFTALMTEMEFTADIRLERPLGTLERPRPQRAEALISQRSLHNLTQSLTAIRTLAEALAGGNQGEMFDRLGYAEKIAARLKDPVFAEVATTSGRFRVQELHDAIVAARAAMDAELGAKLGVKAGFNALDGD